MVFVVSLLDLDRDERDLVRYMRVCLHMYYLYSLGPRNFVIVTWNPCAPPLDQNLCPPESKVVVQHHLDLSSSSQLMSLCDEPV